MKGSGARLLCVAALLAVLASDVQAQGIALVGVGPVNRSMGSAGTAAPLDAIGALHWNPGSITAVATNEVSFGIEAFLADVDLSTTVGGVTNKTSGEAGVAPVPAVGWVHHIDGSNVTVGLGLYGIGGFRNNMPMDANNPLLATGPMFADAELFQIAPTIAWQLTDRLSFGVSPTITAARMMFSPLGPPITNAITPGSGNRVHWGAGVQAGLYWENENGLHLGASIKSPQWFEDFRFFTPTGVVKFDLDYPMILSFGAAYSMHERWIIAGDVRYFSFDDATGFSQLGWDNVWAGAIGLQYVVHDGLKLRVGYAINETAVPSDSAFLNVASPLIQKNNISAGGSVLLTDNVDLTFSYIYLVTSSLTGSLPSPPFGANDTLTHEIEAHSIGLGITVRY